MSIRKKDILKNNKSIVINYIKSKIHYLSDWYIHKKCSIGKNYLVSIFCFLYFISIKEG